MSVLKCLDFQSSLSPWSLYMWSLVNGNSGNFYSLKKLGLLFEHYIHTVVWSHNTNCSNNTTKIYLTKMKAGFYKLASSLDFASFSTIFKHWSENSINSGSCMADFIASSLRSAPSIEHNNCLRWGLQSRSFSSFDWPGDKENSSYSHTTLC